MPMPTADCRLLHHGRIMRCLTYLLLLPETLKKSKKVGKLPGKLPVCYEILTLSLTSKKKQQQQQEEEKMAAELYPAAGPNNPNLSTGTTVADTEKTNKEVQVSQAGAGGGGGGGGGDGDGGGGRGSAATTPTTQQNINNNNVEPPSWQCSHPTLRERYDATSRHDGRHCVRDAVVTEERFNVTGTLCTRAYEMLTGGLIVAVPPFWAVNLWVQYIRLKRQQMTQMVTGSSVTST